MYENTVMERAYPENLFYDLTDYEMDAVKLPEDYLASMMYVLYCLPERTRSFILSRYKDGLSFRQIGDNNGVSGARAHEIISNGIDEMRKESRLITTGVKDTIVLCKHSCNHRERQKIVNEYRTQTYREGYDAGWADATNGAKREKQGFPAYESTSILSLDLSCRSTTALTKAGLYTVADIIRSGNEIMDIRALGIKSLREILFALDNIGVDVVKHFGEVLVNLHINLKDNA